MSQLLTTEDLRVLSFEQLGAVLEAMVVAIRADGRTDEKERALLAKQLSEGPWKTAGIADSLIHSSLEQANARFNAVKTLDDVAALGRRCGALLTEQTLREKVVRAMLSFLLIDQELHRQERGVLSFFALGFGVSEARVNELLEARMLTDIHAATARGNREAVERLLSEGASVNARDPNQWTPLHVAVACGQFEIISLLLSRGADVHLRHNRGSTPIFCACNKPYAKAIALLIKAGANPNDVGANGLTPLHIAATFGHLEVVSALVDAGAKPDRLDEEGLMPIHYAAKENKDEALRRLLACSDVNARSASGCTPLHFAADRGFVSTMRLLLDSGALIDAADKDKQTPLFYAASNHPQAVSLLLSRDANVNAIAAHQLTALHIAARGGFTTCAKLLLDAGAVVDARNIEGGTPLFSASVHRRQDVIDLLTAKGADLNAKTNEGRTPREVHGAAKTEPLQLIPLPASAPRPALVAPEVALQEFFEKKRVGAALLRSLLSYDRWLVLSRPGTSEPGLVAPDGKRLLLAFSTPERLQSYQSKSPWLPAGVTWIERRGIDLFRALPTGIEVVGFDQRPDDQARSIHYGAEHLGLLKRWATLLSLERALQEQTLSSAAVQLACALDEYWIPVSTRTPNAETFLALKMENGRVLYPIMTATDDRDLFQERSGLRWLESGLGLGEARWQRGGAGVFRIGHLAVDGVILNPCTSGNARILSLEESDRIGRALFV